MSVTSENAIKHEPSGSKSSRTTAATGNTTDIVRVSRWPTTIHLQVEGGGSGYCDYTTSLPSMIEAGTAVWKKWFQDTVTESTVAYAPGPITGVRGVSVSGAIVLEVVQ